MQWFTELWQIAGGLFAEGSSPSAAGDSPESRPYRFETLEKRRMLDADPLFLGAVYIEEDPGTDDNGGDTFEVSFTGGAAGTTLDRVTISGDHDGLPTLGTNDLFFDTTKQATPGFPDAMGIGEAFPFTVVSTTGDFSFTVSVADGSTDLVLDFDGFEAGDKLIFEIDVDEVNNLDLGPENGVDEVASGNEFHGSTFVGEFTAPHYHAATLAGVYTNQFDFNGTSLNLSPDNAGATDQQPFGKANRTAGGWAELTQEPLAISIAGTVYHDENLNLTQDGSEAGIADVELALWVKQGESYVDSGHRTTTDAAGDYAFGEDLDLKPGVYKVREAQPDGYFSVGAIPGTVAGDAVGETVSGDRDVLTEIAVPLGGQAAIDYDFAEALPARVSGHVYHDANDDGIRDAGEEGIAGVEIRLLPLDTIAPAQIVTTTTDANGYYEFLGLPPGEYTLVEVAQPTGYLDGKDTAGRVNGATSGVAGNETIESLRLAGGQSGIEYNFGELRPAEIHGNVYLSWPDGNCFGPNGETQPLEGVVIELLDGDGEKIAETTTNADGKYQFTGLRPGEYAVREITPDGLIDGGERVGLINNVQVGVASDDLVTQITLHSGDIGREYDFCEHTPSSLSGHVYHDANDDGLRQLDEEPISGAALQLFDADGTLLSETTSDAAGFYEFTNLRAGDYTVVEIQPSDWLDGQDAVGTIGGSPVGAVDNLSGGDRITNVVLGLGEQGVDYDFGELRPASLSGYVYHDRDNDGLREAGEEGISGVTLQILPILTDPRQPIVTVTTDGDGFYEATGLFPGTYQVIEIQQPPTFLDGIDAAGHVDGETRGTAFNPGDLIVDIPLQSGDAGVEYNFGEIRHGSLRGNVRLTTASGSCYDTATETTTPLPGVVVELLDESGAVLQTTTTDAAGDYQFVDLLPGTYQIREHTPAGLVDGRDHVGTINGIAVGEPGGNDVTSQILIGSGDHGIGYDFCEHATSQLCGFVFHDANDNGLREAGEEGIAGATVRLYDAEGNLIAEKLTGDDGGYCFTELERGTYTIVETQPPGWLDGQDAVGTLGGTPSNDSLAEITLGWGQHGVEYNFGELLPGEIHGSVWADPNRNCVWDDGESPLAGVRIDLLDGDGQLLESTLTDADGNYAFTGLRPGTYRVFEHQPDELFHGDQMPGRRDGGSDTIGVVAGQDLLHEIVVGSGHKLVDYDFCETPTSAISGYVFIDGAPIQLDLGQTITPEEIAAQRTGELTSDDQLLPGVTLELRDGLTGQPIDAAAALPGQYAAGPIRTTTDAHGYYEFAGLPPGNYAVFQIQPAHLLDGVDTPGTHSGIAVNAGQPVSPAVLSTLAVDPANDAIVRIALPAGTHARLNNFSEVRTEVTILPPPPEPPTPPVPPPPVDPPILVDIPLPPPEIFIHLPPPPPPVLGGGPGYTWHLSVIDAGAPRQRIGGADPTVTMASAEIEQIAWRQAKEAGIWTLAVDTDGDGDPETRIERQFGVEGAIPVVGDFNGDGIDEIGLFQDGRWFLDLDGDGVWTAVDLWAQLGCDQDRPVTGDWNGDGKDDIGIYGPMWPRDPIAIEHEPGLPDAENPPTGAAKNPPPRPEVATDGARDLQRTARGEVRRDLIDHVFAYGQPEDIPVAGDWNGDGIRTIGIFRGGRWMLDTNGDGKWSAADGTVQFGAPGDLPVVGDFNGDGIDDLAVFRDGRWTIDNGDRTLDAADRVFHLGGAGDTPVAGDWDGDGADDPGLYRASSPNPDAA